MYMDCARCTTWRAAGTHLLYDCAVLIYNWPQKNTLINRTKGKPSKIVGPFCLLDIIENSAFDIENGFESEKTHTDFTFTNLLWNWRYLSAVKTIRTKVYDSIMELKLTSINLKIRCFTKFPQSQTLCDGKPNLFIFSSKCSHVLNSLRVINDNYCYICTLLLSSTSLYLTFRR